MAYLCTEFDDVSFIRSTGMKENIKVVVIWIIQGHQKCTI